MHSSLHSTTPNLFILKPLPLLFFAIEIQDNILNNMFAKQTKQFNEVAIIDEGVFTKHLTVKVSFLCLITA